jgi:hypothetical protein
VDIGDEKRRMNETAYRAGLPTCEIHILVHEKKQQL